MAPTLAPQRSRAAAPRAPAALPGLVPAQRIAADRTFSTSLARGLRVLHAFGADAQVLGNRDLCERTGLPRSTVSRLTYTLVSLGYLAHAGPRYRLAAGVLSLAYPMLASLRIRGIARPAMLALAQRTGCTVNLALRDRLRVVYIDSCRADPGNTNLPDIGVAYPLLPTAMGRALILGGTRREATAILNRLKLEDPARFAREHGLYQRDAEHHARHGVCVSAGEWLPDYNGVAAPIRSPAGWEPVALNCTIATRTARSRAALTRELGPPLLEAVADIERAALDEAGTNSRNRSTMRHTTQETP